MVCIVPSYNCTFIDCHIIFTSLSTKQIIACVIQVEFLLRAFLKRLYSITYFNKITFNVSTPHLHFLSQIHTNNSNIEAQSSRYGKTVWINFFFTTIRSFDKNFVYLCFSLVFSKYVFKIVSFYRKLK